MTGIKTDAARGRLSAGTHRARTLATLALITGTITLACSAGASARPIDDPTLRGAPATDPSAPAASPTSTTGSGSDDTLLFTLSGIALVAAVGIITARRSTAQRWSAVAAAAGGALWVAFAILAVGQPQGCVGDECLSRSHRDLGELDALFAVGALLILLGLAGLAARVRAAHSRSLIRRASLAAVGGSLALILAGVVTGAVWEWEGSWMALVVPGMVAWVVGFALTGLTILRAEVAPRWVGALLVAGSLALFAANDQDARVLMVIPFGVAWIAVGSVLLHDRGGSRARSLAART
jgi:hypothetical protein